MVILRNKKSQGKEAPCLFESSMMSSRAQMLSILQSAIQSGVALPWVSSPHSYKMAASIGHIQVESSRGAGTLSSSVFLLLEEPFPEIPQQASPHWQNCFTFSVQIQYLASRMGHGDGLKQSGFSSGDEERVFYFLNHIGEEWPLEQNEKSSRKEKSGDGCWAAVWGMRGSHQGP